jgi:type IV secretory pathway VirB10-like protein
VIESLKPYLQVAGALSDVAAQRARQAARSALGSTPAAGVLPAASGGVELVAAQISALADELVAASRNNRAQLVDVVRTEVESVLGLMGLSHQAELQAQLAATNARVRELERELAARDAVEVGVPAPPPPPPAPAISRDSVEEDAEAAARQAVVKRAATKKATTKKATARKAVGETAAAKNAASKQTAAGKTAASQPERDRPATATRNTATKTAATKTAATKTAVPKTAAKRTAGTKRAAKQTPSGSAPGVPDAPATDTSDAGADGDS